MRVMEYICNTGSWHANIVFINLLSIKHIIIRNYKFNTMELDPIRSKLITLTTNNKSKSCVSLVL